MSKCELQVVLDEPERRYRSGETVSGRVRVSTDGEVICKRLVVEQVWRTHGRGNQDEGTFVDQAATEQRWLPGQTYEVPFTFTVPAAPISHHGHLVNVDHYVSARADLPWKIDPSAAADYHVAAGADTPDRYVETEADFGKAAQAALAKAREGKPRSIGGLVAKVLFAPLLLVLAVLVVAMLLALLVIILPFALLALVVRLVRQGSAERKLGAVEVLLETRKLEKARDDREAGGSLSALFSGLKRRLGRLGGATYLVQTGQSVPVTVRFTPKREVELEGVELVIKATESARSGSGTNATTHTHVLVEERSQLSGPLRLAPGHPVDLRGEIFVPPDAAASFRASDNSVTWEAKVAVAIPKWPDWVQTNKLLVVPSPEA